MHYRTLVISDVHLGTTDAKSRELSAFLKNHTCDHLILNGDIIDVWHLKRRGRWKKKDTRVFRRILKMMEEKGTQVTYVKGNHDDVLEQIIPFETGNLRIVRDLVLDTGGKRYFVTHGDIFDVVTRDHRWLAHLGDIGYKLLLWINKRYNQRRRKKGLPYESLSAKVKHTVKMAVNYIGDFETVMVDYAHAGRYDGIICGHIHHPEIKTIRGIDYLNSGDWVESMSALAEDFKGNWILLHYQTIIPTDEGDDPLLSKPQLTQRPIQAE